MKKRYLKKYLGGFSIMLFLILAGVVIFNASTGLAQEDTPNSLVGNLAEDQTSISQTSKEALQNLDTNRIDSTGNSLVIPAADFHSDGFFPDSIFFSFSTGAWEGTSSGDGCMVAPAYLPDNVTITEFWASFIDNDPGNHINFDIYRVNNETGVVDNVAYMNTTSITDSPNIEQHSTSYISYPLVEYPTYTYYLTTCLPTENTKLFGVQIFYTSP